MPEPLSNQSGAEQELPQYIECLLSVSGDAAFLNTFDKAFRSGCGPQWADRPPNTNVWHYGTVLPMESELFGGKAVSLSERLAEDHIRTWSNEGDLVLAPFDKDGTVAKIAPLLERRWLSLQNAADCDGLRDNAG